VAFGFVSVKKFDELKELARRNPATFEGSFFMV
jgi:hypothetical protein